MQREVRRKDRALDEAGAWEILTKADWGVLSLATPDGEPYGVPLNHVVVGRVIYFHCAKQGLKLELIQGNTKAHFTVVTKGETQPEAFSTKYESAMAQGHVTLITDQQVFVHAMEQLCLRHCPGLKQEDQQQLTQYGAATAVLRFDIEKVSAKARR